MKILFMCVANSARSQLAEGLARQMFGNRAEIESAGSQPSRVNPVAVWVLSEEGIDIGKQFSKSADDLSPGFLATLDYAITLCAEEVCPILVSKAKKIHWPLPDPAIKGASEGELLERFRATRDELKKRLLNFGRELNLIDSMPTFSHKPNIELLTNPTRFLFFTGKGGVGKTSVSTAVSLALADHGKSVLLVSTDAASNLDEMLGIELRNSPVLVPNAPGLSVINIDPNKAAESYRERVLAQMGSNATDDERSTVREQLSGACTTEIAAFDEFSDLLAGDTLQYDHIIFDTAPTGHTIRLLSLPKAWTGFLKDNDRGASCLGPHSGLKMQEVRFQAAFNTLCDVTKTTVVLVARPEKGALAEAANTSAELRTLGLANQRLLVNGVFHASNSNDLVAASIEQLGQKQLLEMPAILHALPCDEVPLRAFDTVGLSNLRAFLSVSVQGALPIHIYPDYPDSKMKPLPSLGQLAEELAKNEHALIMVMGKGGVGKTTLAVALAIGLVQRGKTVHLSTTDPAAHVANTLNGELPGLKVSRIDPKAETQHYIEKIMASKGKNLSEQERALLLEDLRSPCTEEVAVFHAFSRIVSEARSSFVVLDTAPTGHSLLLMDATGAYHRQMLRELHGKIVTPLMRLQDASYTHIILVTLPETTPVSQAAALQEDLRRAKIEPYAWVMNKSIFAAKTNDSLLSARLKGEQKQMERVESGLASRLFVVPWLPTPPIGIEELSQLVQK